MERDQRKVWLALTKKAGPIIAWGTRIQEKFSTFIREGITPEELAIFAKFLHIAEENARKIQATTSCQGSHDEAYL